MFIDVPNAKLFALKAGGCGGTPIVAIGGWIGSSELWIDPLAQLSDAHPVVSYDHRGTGLSVCAASDITFDALVADAIAVMDAFGIARRHCGGICRCANGAGGGSALRGARVASDHC